MEKDLPNWRKEIEKGNFKIVKKWLTENVHSYGDLYDPSELIRKITGNELNVKPYLKYLSEKYSKLYNF
jgi:carboxypeptidase Taq